MNQIICSNCHETKPTEAFYERQIYKDGISGRCRVCSMKAATKYAQENKGRINEAKKKRWAEKHPKIFIEPLETPDGRLCRTCGQRKLHDKFRRDPRSKNGRAWKCIECMRLAHAKWTAENREHVRDTARGSAKKSRVQRPDDYKATRRRWWWKAKYGLSEEMITGMMSEQNHRCGICQREIFIDVPTRDMRKMHVDHCHRTNKIRGLLCSSCNTALGKFRDDPAVLRAAAIYIEKDR